MIKVDLITGFLGAGKTTFLLGYARYLMNQGIRIGILEYDLGAMNIDMVLLNKLRGDKCELEMVAAGCDADCLNRRFRTKLIQMAMSGYDRVLVEPSGVFDMDQFFDSLREEPLENWYEIGNVITVVNSKLADEVGEEADFLLASQASCAGNIVFSRSQMASAEEIESTKKHIERAAEQIKCKPIRAKYITKNWEDFTDEDYKMLANGGYYISDYVKITAGSDTSYSSISFMDIKDSLDSLKIKIKKLLSDTKFGNVQRIKGFHPENGISYEINATKYEIEVKPIAIGQNTLIVIGTNLDEVKIRQLVDA